MITPITLETFKQLGFNAGAAFRNLDISPATNAATLSTLAKAAILARTYFMGATKGGINITDVPEYFVPELDGMRIPVKGSRHITGREIKAAMTLVELTADNISAAIGSATVTTAGSIATIAPKADVEDADYIDHLVWIGDKPGSGLVVVDIYNCYNTAGLNMQTTDKDNTTLAVEYTAHTSDPTSEDVPYRIYIYNDSASTVAPALSVYSVEGATTGTTRIAVTPQAGSGQSYKYKTASAVDLPAAGDVLTTGWTVWDGAADITAVTGNQLVIALITTTTNACVRAGRVSVKSKA